MTIYASGWVSAPATGFVKLNTEGAYITKLSDTYGSEDIVSPPPPIPGERCVECGLSSSYILSSLHMLLVIMFPRDIVRSCIRCRQSTGVWVQEFWNSFHDWVHTDPKVKLLLKALSHCLSLGSSSSSLPTRHARCTLISVCDSRSIFQLFAATFWGSMV